MSSRLFAGAGALAIIIAAGNALAAAHDQSFKPVGKPQKASASKLVVPVEPAPLGATVESVLAAGRQLNPALRAALDTSAAAAKAPGADALDDPMISDSYQYYRNPNVFSGDAGVPVWGKQSLRREAALADLDAMRGREQAARDALDERIKVTFAQYYAASRALAVAVEAIKALRACGVEVAMLTGDNTDVLPGDKASKVNELQAQGKKVGLVGDGVNEAGLCRLRNRALARMSRWRAPRSC